MGFFMKIEIITKLDSAFYQDNLYQGIFSYNIKGGFTLLDRYNLLLYKTSQTSDAIKEDIFHNKVFVSNINYPLELDKLYITLSNGEVSTYYITSYQDKLYLLRTYIIPTFNRRIL